MAIQLPITLKKAGSFEAYLAYVSSLPMLDKDQERTFFLDYQENNNLESVQQIILSHLRFVAYIARSYKGYGLPIEDLVQEGTVGLMKSVKKFKLDFDVRLSSFAVHYIKAEIQEYILRNWRLVKSATTKAKRKLFYNLKQLKTRNEWLSNKEKKDIAHQLSVSEKDIDDMEVQLSQCDLFLDAPMNNSNEGSAYFSMNHPLEDHSEPFSTQLINEDFKQKSLHEVRKIIATLDDRSKDIMMNRWLSKEKKSHKFFSNKYGVSQERIRQIEENAIIKLRKNMVPLTT